MHVINLSRDTLLCHAPCYCSSDDTVSHSSDAATEPAEDLPMDSKQAVPDTGILDSTEAVLKDPQLFGDVGSEPDCFEPVEPSALSSTHAISEVMENEPSSSASTAESVPSLSSSGSPTVPTPSLETKTQEAANETVSSPPPPVTGNCS